jgi:hypothetical protein
MMVIKKIVRSFIEVFKRLELWSSEEREKVYFQPAKPAGGLEEIHSIWDYIRFKENTQAFHVSKVLGFEEWVDMVEIRRRTKEVFGVEYKNERSLYPYIKTMDDLGLMESTNAGGRRQWRKKDILIRVVEKGAEKMPAGQEIKTVEVKRRKKEEET